MQGVIKSYDPGTGDGVVVRDTDLSDHDLAAGALQGSVFRMLRQGQRVVFDLDDAGRATALRLGSEVDMGTPGFPRYGSETATFAPEPSGSIPTPPSVDKLTKVADDPRPPTPPTTQTAVADDPSS